MKKYSDKTIEFEYPSGFKVKKYMGGYGICKGKHGLVIDIGLVALFDLGSERTAEDLLEKHDTSYCRRTVVGDVQYGDKKAFVQYFMKYRGDKFLGKAAELLFKEKIKSPLFITIQSSDDYDIEEFRPILESIKIKDITAFCFEEPAIFASDTDDSVAVQLPDEIKYLQPVIGKLNEFDPDELGDDNQEAMDLVEDAIYGIIKDMSDEEAIKLIKNHINILREWLKQSELSESPVAFIQGALIGMLAFKYNDYSVLYKNSSGLKNE